MTYIEFFDRAASENICACLTLAPERVIFLGDNSKRMKRAIRAYTRLFAERGQTIEFLYRSVTKSNLQAAVELLSSLVETYEDCCFDITGGDELLQLALGIVFERYPDKAIQIHRLNLRRGCVYDCDMDGQTIEHEMPMLSAEENIRIYGGDVVYGSVEQESMTYRWEMTEEFCADVERMWAFCSKDVRLWNTQIGVLEAIKKVGTASPDGLTIVANRGAVEHELKRNGAKYVMIRGCIQYLLTNGLLTAFAEEETVLTVSFKNLQVKRCLVTMGQVLEMKVFLTASRLCDEDGTPVYNDALNGVVIDWDGVVHERGDDVKDTKNEIDVLLMHGTIPVFVSCKNGVVSADELYKLETVATRFGAQYAKMVLIATALPEKGFDAASFRQRAADMNIRLIEGVDFDDKLRTVWEA